MAGPQYGGILTFGAENEFRGFDALSVNMLTICDSIVNSTVQERLFDVDGEGKLVPVLRIPCGDAGYRENNLEKAIQLIAEYGRPVEIECLHTKTKRGREFGVMLQQFCKKVGIKVIPQGMNIGPIVKKYTQKSTIYLPGPFRPR